MPEDATPSKGPPANAPATPSPAAARLGGPGSPLPRYGGPKTPAEVVRAEMARATAVPPSSATSGYLQVAPDSFVPNPEMSTEVPGLTKAEAALYLGQRAAFESSQATVFSENPALAMLAKLLATESARAVLNKLNDGQGINTPEGQLWLAAQSLVGSTSSAPVVAPLPDSSGPETEAGAMLDVWLAVETYRRKPTDASSTLVSEAVRAFADVIVESRLLTAPTAERRATP